MTAPLPVPSVAKVTFFWETQAQPWNTVHHVKYGGAAPLGPTEPSSLASAMHGAAVATNSLTSLVSTNTNLVQVHVVDLDPAATAEGDDFSISPGLVSGTGLPMSACVVASWGIASIYRGGKPRTYLSGQVESNLANVNQWTSAWQTTAKANFGTFLAAASLATFGTGARSISLGSVAYHRHHVALTPPLFFPFLGDTVKLQVRTQRRRLGV